MAELTKTIADVGVLVVIAGIFFFNYLQEKRNFRERDEKYNESLKLLAESNNNIAKALDLLNVNSNNNDKLLREHDERSIKMNERLLRLITMMEKKYDIKTELKEREVNYE